MTLAVDLGRKATKQTKHDSLFKSGRTVFAKELFYQATSAKKRN